MHFCHTLLFMVASFRERMIKTKKVSFHSQHTLFNFRYYYPKHNRPDSTDVQDNINEHFDHLVAVVDDVVRCLPDLSTHVQYLKNVGSMHCDVEIQQRLLELMGPVFCNTVRPLLLVQGRWSYQVNIAKKKEIKKKFNFNLFFFSRLKWPGYYCSDILLAL